MSLKDLLKQELEKELPGTDFQNQMLPLHKTDREFPVRKSIKAAVSVIIYSPVNVLPQIILIKRTDYNGPHSGQISFPGGKVDKADITLYETAVRECHEEIGIKLKTSELLGSLTPLNIQVSGFDVTPFVFYIDEKKDFLLNRHEVRYLVPCYLTVLLDKKKSKNTRLHVKEHEILAPYFDIENEIVWGATSMILAELKEILTRIEQKNPGVITSGNLF